MIYINMSAYVTFSAVVGQVVFLSWQWMRANKYLHLICRCKYLVVSSFKREPIKKRNLSILVWNRIKCFLLPFWVIIYWIPQKCGNFQNSIVMWWKEGSSGFLKRSKTYLSDIGRAKPWGCCKVNINSSIYDI